MAIKVSKSQKYVKTAKKVVYKGKERCVYKRVKDGCECYKTKDKSGKVVYRKLKSLKQSGGGCGCGATSPPAGMIGGSTLMDRIQATLHDLKGGNNASYEADMYDMSTHDQSSNTGAVINASTTDPVVVDPIEDSLMQDGGAKNLAKNKKKELYEKAKKYSIRGRSKMTKAQLVEAVRKAHQRVGEAIRKKNGKNKGKSKRYADRD